MEKPYFSIVIPSYNASEVVVRCLESVIAQEYKSFEVIVVDDGSTDASVDIVLHWINSRNQHDCMTLLTKKNGGPASARNYGIERSTGTYVAFLDVDDSWSEDKLSISKNFIDELGYKPDIVTHDVFLKGEENLRHLRCGLNLTYEEFLTYGNTLITSATLVKRTKILEVGGFDESRELVGTEDYDLWLALFKAGASIEVIHRPLTLYYVVDDSLSQHYDRMIKNHMNVVLKHLKDSGFPESKRGMIEKASYVDTVSKIARRLHINGDFKQAGRYYRTAIRKSPLYVKLWILFIGNLLNLKMRKTVVADTK